MSRRRASWGFTLAVAVYAPLSPALALPHQGFQPGNSLSDFVLGYLSVALVLSAPLLILAVYAWIFRNRYILIGCTFLAIELGVMNPILIHRAMATPQGGSLLILLPLQEAALTLALGLVFAVITLGLWLWRRRRTAKT